jgi:regulator of sigma E protease
MSYVLAFLGFVALIILHELGHFVAAKAVGMRVERFSLFFPPLLFKVRRGETEYGIGAIPLGGYVKITGMSPHEDIPADCIPRAYYNQAVWKRVVTILAGPLVNILVAFIIVAGLLLSEGQTPETGVATTKVAAVLSGTPAAGQFRAGDQVVSVDGAAGSEKAIHAAIQSHRCAGAQADGCVAATAADVVVRRAGQLVDLAIKPRRTKAGMEVGIEFGERIIVGKTTYPSIIGAAGDSGTRLWSVTKQTVSAIARIFEPKERKQLSGVVGVYTATQESFSHSSSDALSLLALISLSLGVVNLFPFLPLDGGHIFWAVAEKVRGRRIPYAVMERAGLVGFVLIAALFAIGLSNDISTLSGKGFGLR